MTTSSAHLRPRQHAKLLRDLVAQGPFGLPVANRLAPRDGARKRRNGVAIVDGAVFVTLDSAHWVCNASAAVIMLLAEDAANLQADLETLYGGPIDPAMVALGEARLTTLRLLER